MVVPCLAYNGQWDRVTACHMTIPSHCHNKLPRRVVDVAPDAGRTPVFPNGFRFWITMVAIAKSPLLSKVAQATWSPNELWNFPLSLRHKPHNAIRNGSLCLPRRRTLCSGPCHVLHPTIRRNTNTIVINIIAVRYPPRRGPLWFRVCLRILRNLMRAQERTTLSKSPALSCSPDDETDNRWFV